MQLFAPWVTRGVIEILLTHSSHVNAVPDAMRSESA